LPGVFRAYGMEDGMIEYPNIDSVGIILIDQLAERIANTFIASLPEAERLNLRASDLHELETTLFTEVCEKIEAQLEVMRNRRIYQESYAKVQ
jgi:hypothetical protein